MREQGNLHHSSDHVKLNNIIELESFGEMDKALSEIDVFQKEIGQSGQVVKCRMLMCTGKLDDAINLSNILLTDIKRENNQSLELEVTCYEALSYIYANKLDNAFKVLQQADSIFNNLSEEEQKHDGLGITWFYWSKGLYYERIGEFDKALTFIKLSLPLIRKHQFLYYLSVFLGILGRIHDNRGELDTALDYYDEELAVAKKAGNDHRLGRSMQNLARIHWKKNKLQKAFELYKKSLDLFQASDNVIYVPETIYNLVLLSLKLNNDEQANSMLMQLKALSESSKEKDIIFRYQLARAAQLKKSKRIIMKSKAQALFQEAADEENLSYELTTFAILNLCDLLLAEIKAYGEEEVLKDIHIYLSKLKALANREHIFPLLIESLLLQAKVHVIEGNLSKALSLLDQARVIAEEKTLNLLLSKVITEKNQLEQEYDKLQAIFQSNSSIHGRLEQDKMREYLEKAQQYFNEKI